MMAVSWQYHRDAPSFKSPGELWSDRAGYYIYSPAVFFYGFDTHKMPPDLDMATGGGFSIDTVKNKLDTKYTYGVALLQLPFFASAHLLSRILGQDDEDGFSFIYMRMMMLASVVYLTLGLRLLYEILRKRFKPMVSATVILLVLMGTNLFYYSLIDGIMSHLYSFFLFCLFLFFLQRFSETGRYRDFFVLSVAFALIVLIRPTNLMLIMLLFIWNMKDPGDISARWKRMFKGKYLVTLAGLSLLFYIPQMAYWRYLTGDFLHFSYRGEGFTGLTSPAIAEVLFSPLNGLIPYTPLVLFMIAGMVLMFKKKLPDKWLYPLMFTIVTMVCASWSMWYFGCSYGQRSYIEYYALLAIPLGYMTGYIYEMRRWIFSGILCAIMLFMVYVNIRFVTSFYRFERCWYGSVWDWDTWFRAYGRAGVIPYDLRINNFSNDFDNLALFPARKPSTIFVRSGPYCLDTRNSGNPVTLWSARLHELGYPYLKNIRFDGWFRSLSSDNRSTGMILTVHSGGKQIFSDKLNFQDAFPDINQWTRINHRFIVPDVADTLAKVSIIVVNPRKRPLYLDDMELTFRYDWHEPEIDQGQY
jgi:hypothetical protein